METHDALAGVAEVGVCVTDLNTVIGKCKDNRVNDSVNDPDGLHRKGGSISPKSLYFTVAPGTMKGHFRFVLSPLATVVCEFYKEMDWEEQRKLIVATVTQNTEKFNQLTSCASETDNDLKPAAKPVAKAEPTSKPTPVTNSSKRARSTM